MQEEVAQGADRGFKRDIGPRYRSDVHELKAFGFLGVELEIIEIHDIAPRKKVHIAGRVRNALILVHIREGSQKIDMSGRPTDLLVAFAECCILCALAWLDKASRECKFPFHGIFVPPEHENGTPGFDDDARGRGDIMEVLEAAGRALPHSAAHTVEFRAAA